MHDGSRRIDKLCACTFLIKVSVAWPRHGDPVTMYKHLLQQRRRQQRCKFAGACYRLNVSNLDSVVPQGYFWRIHGQSPAILCYFCAALEHHLTILQSSSLSLSMCVSWYHCTLNNFAVAAFSYESGAVHCIYRRTKEQHLQRSNALADNRGMIHSWSKNFFEICV